MIHFVVTEKGSFSIRAYLTDQGSAVADRINVVLYRELARMRQLRLGTWVFTELDQLDGPRRELATFVAERLDATGAGVKVMNDPRRVRLRIDLLRAAREAGINEHRAFAATNIVFDGSAHPTEEASRAVAAESLHYPVFVRYANEHTGNQTPLLDSPRRLATEIASLVAGGVRRRELLVVEFCDTKDERGFYRKYSAYCVDGHILARSLETSRDWMVKWRARVLDRECADDELRYVETNPHQAWIREMFRLARIDYGRIDYGVQSGTPRLWEINTNPTIARSPRPDRERPPEYVAYRAMVAPARAAFFEDFLKAWVAVDMPAAERDTVPLDVPETIRRGVERSIKQHRSVERVGSLINAVVRQPWVRPVTHAVKRALTPILAARFR